jgi:hypothetical protein
MRIQISSSNTSGAKAFPMTRSSMITIGSRTGEKKYDYTRKVKEAHCRSTVLPRKPLLVARNVPGLVCR